MNKWLARLLSFILLTTFNLIILAMEYLILWLSFSLINIVLVWIKRSEVETVKQTEAEERLYQRSSTHSRKLNASPRREGFCSLCSIACA